MSNEYKLKPGQPFTDPYVKNLAAPPKGQDVTILHSLSGVPRSLLLRLSYGGAKTWKVLYYVKGKARAHKIGRYPDVTVAKAYAFALAFDPNAKAAASAAGKFEAVANLWFKKRVQDKYITEDEIRRQLDTYILPTIGDTDFYSVDLPMIQDLLERVREKRIKSPIGRLKDDERPGRGRTKLKVKLGGARQAELIRATLRSIMSFQMEHDKRYESPMDRVKVQYRSPKRKRTLDDDELKVVWRCTENLGTYGALVRMLLLTAQRLDKVQNMKWADVKNGLWTIASESEREKGTAEVVRLPKMARDILDKLPEVDGNPHVFPASIGKGSFNSLSKSKKRLDDLVKEQLPDIERWTHHDLRRTARTRMSKIKVPRDHAELVIGHKFGGVEETYDRHDYINEMSDVLSRLARHIGEVVKPSKKAPPPKKRRAA